MEMERFHDMEREFAAEFGREFEMAREFEGHEFDPREFEFYREFAPIEREFDARLDLIADTSLPPPPTPGEPAPPPEPFVRMDPEGPVHLHSDDTCHNHGSGLPDNC
jgi:hypothetical protein